MNHDIDGEIIDLIRKHKAEPYRMALEIIALRAELAALREAQRWIPVGERLPEPDKVVWVYRRYLTGYEVCEGFLSGGDFNWYANTLSAPRIGVTHWMPIKEPEPPTEAQGESNEQEEE